MLKAYRDHVAERAALGIPPLPLSAKQTGEVIELLKAPPAGEEAFLVDLITHRVRRPRSCRCARPRSASSARSRPRCAWRRPWPLPTPLPPRAEDRGPVGARRRPD